MSISHVQATTAQTSGTNGFSATLTGVGAGNMLTLVVAWTSATTIVSATDSQGNGGSGSVVQVGSSHRQQTFYFYNTSSGSTTLTVTFSASVAQAVAIMTEWSGARVSAPFDQSAKNFGTSTSPSAGSVTTATSNEFLYSASVIDGVQTLSTGSGWTAGTSLNDSGSTITLADQWRDSAAGTYSDGWSAGVSAAWTAETLAFFESGNAAAPIIQPQVIKLGRPLILGGMPIGASATMKSLPAVQTSVDYEQAQLLADGRVRMIAAQPHLQSPSPPTMKGILGDQTSFEGNVTYTVALPHLQSPVIPAHVTVGDQLYSDGHAAFSSKSATHLQSTVTPVRVATGDQSFEDGSARSYAGAPHIAAVTHAPTIPIVVPSETVYADGGSDIPIPSLHSTGNVTHNAAASVRLSSDYETAQDYTGSGSYAHMGGVSHTQQVSRIPVIATVGDQTNSEPEPKWLSGGTTLPVAPVWHPRLDPVIRVGDQTNAEGFTTTLVGSPINFAPPFVTDGPGYFLIAQDTFPSQVSGVWQNPANAEGSPNGQYASYSTLTQGIDAGWLYLTDPSITPIPYFNNPAAPGASNPIICGFSVALYGHYTGGTDQLWTLQLLINGHPAGSKRQVPIPLGASDGWSLDIGGSYDTWGISASSGLLAPTANVNIGVRVNVQKTDGSDFTVNIDAGRMTVFYRANPVFPQQMQPLVVAPQFWFTLDAETLTPFIALASSNVTAHNPQRLVSFIPAEPIWSEATSTVLHCAFAQPPPLQAVRLSTFESPPPEATVSLEQGARSHFIQSAPRPPRWLYVHGDETGTDGWADFVEPAYVNSSTAQHNLGMGATTTLGDQPNYDGLAQTLSGARVGSVSAIHQLSPPTLVALGDQANVSGESSLLKGAPVHVATAQHLLLPVIETMVGDRFFEDGRLFSASGIGSHFVYEVHLPIVQAILGDQTATSGASESLWTTPIASPSVFHDFGRQPLLVLGDQRYEDGSATIERSSGPVGERPVVSVGITRGDETNQDGLPFQTQFIPSPPTNLGPFAPLPWIEFVYGDETYFDVPPYVIGAPIDVTPTSSQSRCYFERIVTGPGYYQRQATSASTYSRTPGAAPDLYKREDKPC